MSKASEYIELCKRQRETPSLFLPGANVPLAWISAEGTLHLHERGAQIVNALKVADWIYDTFGEKDQ